MTSLTLSQKLKALYHENWSVSTWERDMIVEAYGVSAGGEKPFHLTQKQQENIEVIFERVYQ